MKRMDRRGKALERRIKADLALAYQMGYDDALGRRRPEPRKAEDMAGSIAPDDYTTALMNEFVRVLDERDTLNAKFEVAQSMRHAENERYKKENAKLRELVRFMWCADYAGNFSTAPEHQEQRAAVWRQMCKLGIEVDA